MKDKRSQFCVAAILACGLLCGPKSKAEDQQPNKKDEVRAGAPASGLTSPQIIFETRILKGSFRFFDEEGQKKGLAGADFQGGDVCLQTVGCSHGELDAPELFVFAGVVSSTRRSARRQSLA